MFSKELSELLFQVIKSWQVIAVTVALVLYMSLVGYVLRAHRKPASVSKTKPKKKRKAQTDAKPAGKEPAGKEPAGKEPAGEKITEQE